MSEFGPPVNHKFDASCDGSVQRYVELVPADYQAGSSRDVMIALHGHGANRWQYVKEERDECRGARDCAGRYGMVFVSPDYRAFTSWMGPAAESDLLDIVGELRARYAPGRIFLVGGSMGGTSALTFAVRHPALIDGVVSHNGHANHVEYENFQDAISESFGGTKQQVPQEYRERSAEFFAERLTMPVALAVGGKDESVPPHSVLRLAERLRGLNPNVLLIHRPEGGHATDYEDTVATIEFVICAAGAGNSR